MDCPRRRRCDHHQRDAGLHEPAWHQHLAIGRWPVPQRCCGQRRLAASRQRGAAKLQRRGRGRGQRVQQLRHQRHGGPADRQLHRHPHRRRRRACRARAEHLRRVEHHQHLQLERHHHPGRQPRLRHHRAARQPDAGHAAVRQGQRQHLRACGVGHADHRRRRHALHRAGVAARGQRQTLHGLGIGHLRALRRQFQGSGAGLRTVGQTGHRAGDHCHPGPARDGQSGAATGLGPVRRPHHRRRAVPEHQRRHPERLRDLQPRARRQHPGRDRPTAEDQHVQHLQAAQHLGAEPAVLGVLRARCGRPARHHRGV